MRSKERERKKKTGFLGVEGLTSQTSRQTDEERRWYREEEEASPDGRKKETWRRIAGRVWGGGVSVLSVCLSSVRTLF